MSGGLQDLLGQPLINLFIPPTFRPDAPDMSLQERLVGGPAGMKGAITYYTQILAVIAAIISTYYIVYAGYIMFTAFGDEAKYALGKKTLLYAIIGFVVSMLSFFLVVFFVRLLGYQGDVNAIK